MPYRKDLNDTLFRTYLCYISIKENLFRTILRTAGNICEYLAENIYGGKF